jgi:hypothetical protein
MLDTRKKDEKEKGTNVFLPLRANPIVILLPSPSPLFFNFVIVP